MKRCIEYVPKSISSPGWLISEESKCLGISRSELAKRLDISTQTLYGLFSGKIPLSHEFAMKLESVLGIEAEKWDNLEAGYRRLLYKLNEFKEKEKQFLEEQPYGALEKMGLVRGQNDQERYRSLLSFYQVANVGAYKKIWSRHAKSGMEAAIVRYAEILSSGEKCAKYNRKLHKNALYKLLENCGETIFEEFLAKARKELARAGVILNVINWERNRVLGAAKWLKGGRAMVLLNSQGQSRGQCLYALAHENGHILEQRKLACYLASREEGRKEEKADRFAYELLLPSKADQEVKECQSRQDLEALAKKYKRPLCVVADRYARLTGDKKKFARLDPKIKWPKGVWHI